jgi:diaminopimelate epimerase
MPSSHTNSKRPFIKMHGLQNHFVIVDGRDRPYHPERDDVIRICDGNIGIGADQLVVIEPSEVAEAFMRLYNVDGREAQACGNATRCVAGLLMENTGKSSITLETRVGLLHCERTAPMHIRCDLGRIQRHRDADLLATISEGPLHQGFAVDLGNPHIVFFVADLQPIQLERLAPKIQQNRHFPESVNVGVASITSSTELTLKVYERAAGLTMACGSGASAAVFAAQTLLLLERKATCTVNMPGGCLEIEISEDQSAIMTGPFTYCFEGTLP